MHSLDFANKWRCCICVCMCSQLKFRTRWAAVWRVEAISEAGATKALKAVNPVSVSSTIVRSYVCFICK
jgi:hypothetical protein